MNNGDTQFFLLAGWQHRNRSFASAAKKLLLEERSRPVVQAPPEVIPTQIKEHTLDTVPTVFNFVFVG